MKLAEILDLGKNLKTENIRIRGKEYKIMKYSYGSTVYYNREGILGYNDTSIDWGSLLNLYKGNTRG